MSSSCSCGQNAALCDCGPVRVRVSRRELQVWRSIALGQTSREAAAELQLSPKTVDIYRHHLMTKLRVRGRVALAVLGLRLDVVSLREIALPNVLVTLPGEAQ